MKKDGSVDLTGNWTIANNNITLTNGTLKAKTVETTGINAAYDGVEAFQFTVAPTTGNTFIGGNLSMNGGITSFGNFAISNKFTVAAASGNTAIAGTLGVTGATTLTGSLTVNNDITTGSGNAFYFGDASTDGSWRITRNGNNLVFERRESGAWVTKVSMQP